MASLLIPRRLRQDFYNIYAFCRWSDDLADESGDPQIALQKLRNWRSNFQSALLAQDSPDPILLAATDTIQRLSLDANLFFLLLDAFEQDQARNRYQTHAQVLDYCQRSANPVGRILLGMAGVNSETQLDQSDAICSGLQIANFCQDMNRDAAINRIYMPTELAEKHDVNETMVLAGKSTPQLCEALSEWVQIARRKFIFGWDLSFNVPRWLARDVQLFASGGLAICDAIAANHYDVWTKRPTVSKLTKMRLLARAMIRTDLPTSRYFASNWS